MTNLEALKANLSDAHGLILTDAHFAKALADNELDSSATYSSDSKNAIDRATIPLLEIVLSTGTFSEDGVSYSVDLASVRKQLELLQLRFGLISKRAVRGATKW